MRDGKSLAAEIEAVLMRDLAFTIREVPGGGYNVHIDVRAAVAKLAEIAANQSRAFEDGARWMQDRVGQHLASTEDGYAAWDRWIPRLLAEEIAALSLQPAGERSDA